MLAHICSKAPEGQKKAVELEFWKNKCKALEMKLAMANEEIEKLKIAATTPQRSMLKIFKY